jgi:hypothetical protein
MVSSPRAGQGASLAWAFDGDNTRWAVVLGIFLDEGPTTIPEFALGENLTISLPCR